MTRRTVLRLAAAASVFVVIAACTSAVGPHGTPAPGVHAVGSRSASAALGPEPRPTTSTTPGPGTLLPGMPAPLVADDVYAANRTLSPVVAGDRPLVYVPNSRSDTVSVIDQRTMKVINTFPVGHEPQHVVPSYDLRTLYVTADENVGAFTPINPRTGTPGKTFRIVDPYNLYFTPDGRRAIVVAEAFRQLDFYEPHTWELLHSLSLPRCEGVDHMDFTADGRLLLASCEFADRMVVVDVATESLVRTIRLPRREDGMPQDVKLSPDGTTFYVADMMANGVYEIDGAATKVIGFIPTGAGTHGLYVNRTSTWLFVTNRGEGSVTVLDLATRRPVAKWRIPGGGSPDMGNVSADGTVLWVSGRYDGVVYAISTDDGHLIKKIAVGAGPHGLCVWPQPGRYSLGHTGVMR